MYVGTFKWTVLMPFIPLDKWPDSAQLLVEIRGVDELVSQNAGFDLWKTTDGINWSPVTRTGFENMYNWGVRTMASTPYGLFIGTANPFGPEVAERTEDGWQYLHNPRGGTEVWLGVPRNE